ncbi:MAG TPA: putative Ig domain-containing protein [archaeon]|nr:putative Ig domain-containing protein [archaeon]
MTKFKNVILAIIILSMNVSIVNAAEYYIAPYGDNGNTGLSLNQAWASLSWAVNSSGKVHSDTIIYIVDGIYYDSASIMISDNNDGSIAHPLVIKAYNGTPIFDGVDAETNDNSAFLIKGSSAYSTGYVTISNLTFRNYKQIFDIRNAENITLSNNTFYNVRVSQSYGLGQISYATRNITIDSNIFHNDVGYNSLAIAGTLNDSNRVHHIYVTNNQIYNNDKHAGIQWENADDVYVIGNRLWNNTYSGGIAAYKGNPYRYIKNSIVRDCTFDNVATPLYIYSSENGLWEDITIHNSGKILLYGNNKDDEYGLSNLTMRNVTITNPTGLIVYLTGNGVAKNILFERFNVSDYPSQAYDWRIQDTDGNITIRDEVDEGYKILLKSTESDRNASIKIEYSDWRVFEITSISGDANITIPATWHPTVSNYTEEIWGVKDRRFKITAYPMTARPTTNPATITVNKFDTSLPQGNILISFTASTTNGNNVVFTVNDLSPGHNYLIKRGNVNFTSRQANSSGSIQFSNSDWPEHTFTIRETSSGNIGDSGEGPSITEFFPVDTSPVQNNGFTYEFNVNANQPLTSSSWYLDDDLITSETLSLNHMWTHASNHNITFTGSNANGSISKTWTVTVTDASQMPSSVTITPSSQTVAPNQPFTLIIPITPATPITGAQFDLLFDSSLATVTSVTEGNLLNQDSASTLFNSRSINNDAGTVRDIYGSILGETSISAQGSMATISMTAGSTTGYLDLNLTNVIISDTNSNAAPYTLTSATVLIDTAPVLGSIGARSVDVEDTLAFTVSASDVDGDSLTYSATGLPNGASFDTASGAFSWTPADGDATTYVVTFEVTDGYLSDSEVVTITVNEGNHAPVITAFEPADGSVFDETDTINIRVTASDVDGQALSYNIKIDGVTQSSGPGYTWETDYSSGGNHIILHKILVTVSDGTEQISSQHIITIKNVHPRWDVNVDRTVNILDITMIGQKFGVSVNKPYPRYDVNQDGIVNIQDLTITGNRFGETVA